MRIDLSTPFAEKDAAKALGARWDAARRVWYITDVADLAPFARWLPDAGRPPPGPAHSGPTARAVAPGARTARVHRPAPPAGGGTVTSSLTVVVHCGCAMLPWEPCHHE